VDILPCTNLPSRAEEVVARSTIAPAMDSAELSYRDGSGTQGSHCIERSYFIPHYFRELHGTIIIIFLCLLGWVQPFTLQEN
jgi:hypothetical protein